MSKAVLEEAVGKYGPSKANTVVTPMDSSVKLIKNDG